MPRRWHQVLRRLVGPTGRGQNLIRKATVARKPDRRGEHEISRKTIAWGRWANLVNLVSAHAFLFFCVRRLRVRQAPGVPHALSFEKANYPAKPRANPCSEIVKPCLKSYAVE